MNQNQNNELQEDLELFEKLKAESNPPVEESAVPEEVSAAPVEEPSAPVEEPDASIEEVAEAAAHSLLSDETGLFQGLSQELHSLSENEAASVNDDTIWLGDLLAKPELGQEIGPDEHAVSSAGLSELSDMELEKILEEAKSADWGAPQEDQEQVPVLPVREFMDEEYREAFGEGQELEQMFDAPDAQNSNESPSDYTDDEVPDYMDREDYAAVNIPIRKGRPKRKKGYGLLGIPHILATLIWLAIIVAIGVSLGRMLWLCAADVLAFGRSDQVVSVVIEEGDTAEDIANKLHDAGLIRYPGLFQLYADLANVAEEAIPGTYSLNTLYDYHALSNAISHVSTVLEEVEVAIPEGYSCAQMFAFLEEKGVCSAQELQDFVINGELGDYWFLEGIDRSNPNCLEGYLFPDTYMFYKNGSAAHVFKRLLDNFDRKFDEKLQAKIETLNKTLTTKWKKNGLSSSYIKEHQMTVHDVIILASIIEKESGSDSESATIASVFYNRLTNPSKYPYLQSDATVVYAHGGKNDLTAEDYQLDSPYNTYVTKGLPAGPISNPGLNSIMAALDPESTSYYFFVYDASKGIHRFSKTLKEHQQWIDKLGG